VADTEPSSTTTTTEALEPMEPTEPTEPAALEAGPEAGADVEEHDEHDTHGHPTTVQYVGIAMLLAVVTGIEVGIYYIEMSDYLLVAVLLGLAFIKFSTVAAYFMHLKFDSRLLRRLFITGIALAAVIYMIVLFTMDILVG
jgi:cytochrome c oxidase subunit 4